MGVVARRQLALVLCAVLFSAGCSPAPAPAPAPARAADPATVTPLRFLEYNICGSGGSATTRCTASVSVGDVAPRVAKVHREVHDWDADVVFLNEVCERQYRAIHADLLAAGYQGYFAKATDTSAGCRAPGDARPRSKGGPEGVALFVKGGVAGASRTYYLGNRLTDRRAGGEQRFLLCADGLLDSRAAKICVTHLDPRAPAAQAALLAADALAWVRAGVPTVIGGDFNLEATDPALDALKTEFVDVDAADNEATYDTRKSNPRKIDYIFVSRRHFADVAGDVPGPDESISDHDLLRGAAAWADGVTAPTATPGDFNADGTADLGVLYDTGSESSTLYSFASSGTQLAEPRAEWADAAWPWAGSIPVGGDFNGDRRADIAILRDGGTDPQGVGTMQVWMSWGTASGYAAPVMVWDSASWTGGLGWRWAASKPVAGDFNGDGRTDLAVLYDGGTDAAGNSVTRLWQLSGTGSGVGPPVMVWDSASWTGGLGWQWAASKPVAGDFNGDGRTDLVVLYDYGTDAAGADITKIWQFNGAETGVRLMPAPVWSSVPHGPSWRWASSMV